MAFIIYGYCAFILMMWVGATETSLSSSQSSLRSMKMEAKNAKENWGGHLPFYHCCEAILKKPNVCFQFYFSSDYFWVLCKNFLK